MKLSRFFSSVFAVLGTGVMIVSIILCLLCRNMEPKTQGVAQEAEDVSEQFIGALSSGDYQTAGELIYGQPELGADGAFQSDAAARIWETFRESISCEDSGACYLEGTEIYRDVTVTFLDVSGVLNAVPALAQSMQAAQEAEPDEEAIRKDSDAILMEAVEKALSDGERVSVQGKLQLVQDEGRWYVIPDKTVLSAISGGSR